MIERKKKQDIDILQLQKNLSVPKKIKDYVFSIIQEQLLLEQKKQKENNIDLDQIENKIYDYILKKINKKIFPKTYDEDDKIFQNSFKLSWIEPKHLIKKENITKKIDLYRTNYQEKMRLNEFYDTQGINLLEKDYFEEEKKNIMNKLGNIYEFQIDKNIKNTEKILKGKISNDNNVFNQRLIDGKYETLNEINDEFKNIFNKENSNINDCRRCLIHLIIVVGVINCCAWTIYGLRICDDLIS